MNFLGIDVGGTKLSCAIYNSDNDHLQKGETMTVKGLSGEDIAGKIIELVNKSIAEDNISAAGICIPGIVYQDTGEIWAPNIEGWINYPLGKQLKKHIASNIPVYLENDRACYIMGEVWKGEARGLKNAIYLAVGTGIGAGILVDGMVLRGANDIAGAIGWMALETEYKDGYEDFGCFEFSASGDGLKREADLIKPGLYNNGEEIFESYEKGDRIAGEIINKAVRLWGKAAANLVSIFNPEVIIFGGGVFGPVGVLLDDIYSEAKKWAQPISINKVTFKLAKLGSEAGLLGTIYMVKSKYFNE